VAQPLLGRVADVSGYGASVIVSAAIRALALPFVLLARRENAPSDPITADEDDEDRREPEDETHTVVGRAPRT